MRRHVRATHLGRIQLNPLLNKLKLAPVAEWPEYLAAALELLHSKSPLTDSQKRSVVIDSVKAAHACARANNFQLDSLVRNQALARVGKTTKRVANCMKRAPLKLRRRLDEVVNPLVQQDPIDTETIEAIFDAAVTALLEFTNEESATTALYAMCGEPPYHGDAAARIKNDYSTLNNSLQRKAENAIATIARAAKHRISASDVFRALASALDPKQSKKVSNEIHVLIVDYVATVAGVWRGVGLKPTRARTESNPAYTSKFHLFVDRVLTAMIEPWALRDESSREQARQKARTNHSSLPAEFKTISAPVLKRSDTKWLVSDDHVKKAS